MLPDDLNKYYCNKGAELTVDLPPSGASLSALHPSIGFFFQAGLGTIMMPLTSLHLIIHVYSLSLTNYGSS